jgi:3',5'-cyclic AMP phosphodiesterase CpdA
MDPIAVARRIAMIVGASALASTAGCGSGESTFVPSGTTIPGMQSLIVFGDWGARAPAQVEVAATMADRADELDVAAIVTTGDNFYSNDAESLMEPYEWASEQDIPFLVSWGNHDIETGTRSEIVNETFADPPRWVVHEWGKVDILILDSNQVEAPEQLDFITSALDSSNDPTMVVFHHPPFSCGVHGDTEAVIEAWVPLFDEDVFLVLNGHEHNYQRFAVDGVTYVVTGGGGSSLTELADCSDDHPDRLAGRAIHHFLTLEQRDDTLAVTALDLDGVVIDDVAITLP